MTKVISTNSAEHFVWGDNCDGWWLKKAGRFTVISELMPAGTSEIKHFHKETEQFFYILEGMLTIELNDTTYELHKDESITIVAGAPHRVYNNTNGIVKFIVVSCPDSHNDRVNL